MTTDSINTENVYALVVGIEKYKGGSDWDLNGPANDALKFASWLLDRGVKPEHVQLFLSPLDKNAVVLEEAKAKGLNPLPADRNPIDSAIRSSLTSEGNRGDLLHVFWGGHAIVTKTDATTRRLFFADTDNINKWNLNLNSLVEALSTFAHGSGFKQQNFWIDACANTYYQGLYETIGAEAAASKFITNGEQGKAEHFVLFAAAEYEVATNESAEGTGRFSRAVLDQLEGKTLLPDMEVLAKKIQANFLEKRSQPPVYWWISNGGNQRVIDNTKPSQRGVISLTPKQMKDLHQALLEAFPDESDLEMLVQFHLQTRLNRISMAKKYDKVVFDVIQFVNSRGKVRELVKGAIEDNPDSPFLSNIVNYLS
jgi:Effector-associated domain 1/Caspase domain